jgi:acyl carrier protein
MTEAEILGAIEQQLASIMTSKGLPAPKIAAGTQLLGGDLGIDSLDLAVLVSELESVIGHDPFRNGFIEFRTAGELAKLYVK